MSGAVDKMPPGWHVDPETGAWMRDTIHHMGRRCRKWDYYGTGTYLITLVLNDRSKPLLGRIARLLSGEGAGEIDDEVARTEGVEEGVWRAMEARG